MAMRSYGLLSKLDFSELGSLSHHMLVFEAQNTATQVCSEALFLFELSNEVLGKNFKLLEVLLEDIDENYTSGGLLAD